MVCTRLRLLYSLQNCGFAPMEIQLNKKKKNVLTRHLLCRNLAGAVLVGWLPFQPPFHHITSPSLLTLSLVDCRLATSLPSPLSSHRQCYGEGTKNNRRIEDVAIVIIKLQYEVRKKEEKKKKDCGAAIDAKHLQSNP